MEFAPCDRTELATFDAYLGSLTRPMESFMEEAILGSAFYRITAGGREVGSFGVDPSGFLAQFHLVGAARRHGQEALTRIIEGYGVSGAMVPTFDTFLLGHAFDREHTLSRQAYFFEEAEPGPPAPEEFVLTYRLASVSDVDVVEALNDEFLDRVPERVTEGQVHIGVDSRSEPVAIGLAEPGRLLPRYRSIGMFTRASHRGSGIGRQTLRYLRGVCHAEGLTPIAGCWYYNHASKRTLEAAGMVTETRLLRLTFTGRTA